MQESKSRAQEVPGILDGLRCITDLYCALRRYPTVSNDSFRSESLAELERMGRASTRNTHLEPGLV